MRRRVERVQGARGDREESRECDCAAGSSQVTVPGCLERPEA